jgi:cell division protein FtsL
MNKRISLYYTALLLILGVQIIATVVQGSVVVGHGKKVAQIESQISELTQEKKELSAEIAQSSSLISLTKTANVEDYVSISSPLVITGSTTVAYGGM